VLPLAHSLPELPRLAPPWLALGAYFTLWFIVLLHVRTNLRHYKLNGVLLEGRWARRTALWLADATSVALAVVIGVILAAWHFWGPADPRVGVQASLLGLAGMCVFLVSALDFGTAKNKRPRMKDKRPRIATAWWFVPPYILLIVGTLAMPAAFSPPLVHGVGVADFWKYGIPLAVVLAIVFSKISSSLWDKDPPQAHRRFGPGADNDVYGSIPPPKPYEEPTATR